MFHARQRCLARSQLLVRCQLSVLLTAPSRAFSIQQMRGRRGGQGDWSPPLPLPLRLSFDSEEKRKQDPSRLSGNAILRGRDKCPLLRIRTESLRTAVSVSGKRELPARDKRAGKAAKIRMALGREDVHTRKPPNSGLFTMNREISVCVGLRGGAERTRTSNQTIISRDVLENSFDRTACLARSSKSSRPHHAVLLN